MTHLVPALRDALAREERLEASLRGLQKELDRLASEGGTLGGAAGFGQMAAYEHAAGLVEEVLVHAEFRKEDDEEGDNPEETPK